MQGNGPGTSYTRTLSKSGDRLAPTTWFIPIACIAILIWPALFNGYPIVFADTGTYLSQAMHRYLGWDRPLFYSVFILPLHLGITTWPIVLAQSALTLFVLDLTRRTLGISPWWLLVTCVFLAGATWLPWIVSEIMPDLFTPLLVPLLTLLVFFPSRFNALQRAALTALAAFMIATQQSSVPLAVGLLAVMIPARLVSARSVSARLGFGPYPKRFGPLLVPLCAPGLAIGALILVNVIAFGAVSLSPFGNVFALARVIYDGPGMSVLRRDCPASGWKLCPFLGDLPPTSDEFLWSPTSPLLRAGGHKAVSADADAIIHAALRAAPAQLLSATLANVIEQLGRFESGDGLTAWQNVDAWIDRDFPPREAAAYHAAAQQNGTLAVPPPLPTIHHAVALAGLAAALALAPVFWHRRHGAVWFLAAALLTWPLSAAITGGLSTPHDRYQSRVAWLPAAMAMLSAPALIRRRR